MRKKLSLKKKEKTILNQYGYNVVFPYNVILDIDETLIHTSVEHDKMTILLRPQLRTFLDYCYNNFNVGYWTLGTKKYCLHILSKILTTEQLNKTKNSSIIICRTDDKDDKYEELVRTHIFEVNKLDNMLTKPLSYLFNTEPYKYWFKSNNTLIIDNSSNAISINIHNSILIPSFYDDSHDCYLIYLINWLKKIKGNIVKIEKPSFFQY
tara:strand:+ start:1000 stop:1626 length:627 start_codon:yes stop_codon:yes gene_type:complete